MAPGLARLLARRRRVGQSPVGVPGGLVHQVGNDLVRGAAGFLAWGAAQHVGLAVDQAGRVAFVQHHHRGARDLDVEVDIHLGRDGEAQVLELVVGVREGRELTGVRPLFRWS